MPDELAQERHVYEGMRAEPNVEYMPSASLKRLQMRLDGWKPSRRPARRRIRLGRTAVAAGAAVAGTDGGVRRRDGRGAGLLGRRSMAAEPGARPHRRIITPSRRRSRVRRTK